MKFLKDAVHSELPFKIWSSEESWPGLARVKGVTREWGQR
jgi:hypothetical protein